VKPILIVPILGGMFLFSVAAQETVKPPEQTAGQTVQLTPAKREAMDQLNEAARQYREGHFAEARQHSEKALALDPLNKTAPFFIARTIHAQYQPGDKSEANIAIAREAIEAYKRILAPDPQNEEAYKAVAYFYSVLKEEELLRQWLVQRALDPTFSNDKRAEAFVVLGSKGWDCSFKLTELPTNKITVIKGRSLKIQYISPKDPAEFQKARQCADEGLAFVENAIALDPDSESAWSYKTNLLLELSKLAEMDHKLLLKAEYEKQSVAAQNTTFELSKKRQDQRTTKP